MPGSRGRSPAGPGTACPAGLPPLLRLPGSYLPLLPFRPPMGLFIIPGETATFDAADRLLAFHAALFALGDEPTFTAYGAENTALYDLLPKALEQRVLRFTTAEHYHSHV